MTEEEFFSLRDVADRLKVSEQTVRRWVKSGRLKAYKPGLEYRILESDLQEFLERRAPKAPAPPSPSDSKDEDGEWRASRVTLFRENIEHFTHKWQEELKHPERQEREWVVGVQATAIGLQEIVRSAGLWRRKEEASEREWVAMLGLLLALGNMHDTADRVLEVAPAEIGANEVAERRRADFTVIQGELSA